MVLQIEMGSTNVRIGSTIFGAREYPEKRVQTWKVAATMVLKLQNYGLVLIALCWLDMLLDLFALLLIRSVKLE